MSNHSLALVPLECWAYLSPDQRCRGRLVDVGLLAESLIYYDRVLINVTTEKAFAALVEWFYQRGLFDDLLTLIQGGTITCYHYAFITAPIEKDGVFGLYNLHDEEQARATTFHSRVLGHRDLVTAVGKERATRLAKVLDGRVVEVKSDDFGAAVDNARADSTSPERMSVAIQAMLDDVYPLARLGQPPEIGAAVNRMSGGRTNVDWKIDFDPIHARLSPKGVGVTRGTPLWGLATSNRFLLSAAQLNCDIFTHSPMSRLIGAKLAETGARNGKVHDLIDRLEKEVEFPDVRWLINGGKIGFRAALELRRKGTRFREWLQQEGERDRDALFAYHRELNTGSDFTKYQSKVLRLFKVVAPAATRLMAPDSLLAPAIAGGAGVLLDTLAARLSADWKPVVFGDWSMRYVAAQIDKVNRDRGAILGIDRGTEE